MLNVWKRRKWLWFQISAEPDVNHLCSHVPLIILLVCFMTKEEKSENLHSHNFCWKLFDVSSNIQDLTEAPRLSSGSNCTSVAAPKLLAPTLPVYMYLSPLLPHLHMRKRRKAESGRDSEMKAVAPGGFNAESTHSLHYGYIMPPWKGYSLHKYWIMLSQSKVYSCIFMPVAGHGFKSFHKHICEMLEQLSSSRACSLLGLEFEMR